MGRHPPEAEQAGDVLTRPIAIAWSAVACVVVAAFLLAVTHTGDSAACLHVSFVTLIISAVI
jgi:hypothetical protein